MSNNNNNKTRRLRPSQGGKFHDPVYPVDGVDALGFPNARSSKRVIRGERATFPIQYNGVWITVGRAG